MTSLPPPPPPPPPSSAHPSSGGGDNYGPVTKLAHIAAAQEEEARMEQRRIEYERFKVQAAVVGETALAIAAATASGSPVRLSPKQKEVMLEPPASKKMSVAARARAAADLPTPTLPPQLPNTRSSTSNSTTPNPTKRAPSSGGVMRGKFSKAQVRQMIDEWGRDDTSEDDDSEYYYDVTSDSSADIDSHEQFKQSLENSNSYHHLQYTMSQSPGHPTGVEALEEAAATAAAAAAAAQEEAGFHYQHHRVSSYNTNKAEGNMHGRSSSPDAPKYPQSNEEDEETSGGLFASAKHWLQSQRERLHHMELEKQVEDQRRKLVEEGRKQRSTEADRRRNGNAGHHTTTVHNQNVFKDNSNNHGAETPPELATSCSFGLEGQAGSLEGGPEEELCNIPEQGVVVSGMPNLCDFGGMYANRLDDSTDYSGVARVDSAGNILEMIPSGSFDEDEEGVEHMKVFMKVSSPKCTLTGQGMSVNLDLPDDNDYQQEETNNNALDSYIAEEEEEDEDSPYFVNDVKIVSEPPQDDISESPSILQQSQMKSLIASGGLPPSLNFCKWKRLYSLSRDGDSFEQFLRLVEGHNRTVLAVKTTHDELFGGYADSRWEARHVRRHANEFYGSAQACLFRFPNFGTGRREDKIIIFKWSGANRYVQLCDLTKRTLAFGGGGDYGDFGLCIEDDFRRGTTGHCSTFENDALCEEGYFDVQDLEVWGFTLDF